MSVPARTALRKHLFSVRNEGRQILTTKTPGTKKNRNKKIFSQEETEPTEKESAARFFRDSYHVGLGKEGLVALLIRTEKPEDREAIRTVNCLAFGRDDEARLVAAYSVTRDTSGCR